MATAHLISGLPCSGKTTYARLLKLQTGAVLFRLDVFLKSLYGDYSIEDSGYDEHVRRVLACRTMIWHSCAEFLSRGIDIILDDGFFLKEHRTQHTKLASSIGAEATIHYMATPLDVLEERLRKRNEELPENTFYITDERIKSFEDMYEIPDPSSEGDVRVVNPTDYSPEALQISL